MFPTLSAIHCLGVTKQQSVSCDITSKHFHLLLFVSQLLSSFVPVSLRASGAHTDQTLQTIFPPIWRESSKTNRRRQMTNTRKMDETPETKNVRGKKSRCACDQTGKDTRWFSLRLIRGPHFPRPAISSPHLSPPIKDTFSHNHVTPSSPRCNIPLKGTAIVCQSKTERKKCEAVKTKDKTFFIRFGHGAMWSSQVNYIVSVAPDCRRSTSVSLICLLA